jgi:cobalt-zinc-cadmium efflux system outer membrane protein
LADAASTLTAAHEAVAILQSDVLPKAQQTFAAAEQGYEQGKFDYLYLLDAQRILFETQGQYIDALAAHHKARADIERLTGRPLDVTNKNIPADSRPEPLSQDDSHEK